MDKEKDTFEEDNVIVEYSLKFKVDELPFLPMFKCMSYDDKRYIDMLRYAIDHNRPVNKSDYDKFLPDKKGIKY